MNDKAILICSVCLSRNYEIKKQEKSAQRMEIKKFCKKCQTHTLHKESK